MQMNTDGCRTAWMLNQLQGDEEAYSLLFTYCFRRTADTADRIRAKTVLHQIMICPPNKGGRIRISTNININSGSIKVRM